jgi:hypothetical protein
MNIDGIEIETWWCCQDRWCGFTTLKVRGHYLVCAKCGHLSGRLPKEAITFLMEIVRKFGRPTVPIIFAKRDLAQRLANYPIARQTKELS